MIVKLIKYILIRIKGCSTSRYPDILIRLAWTWTQEYSANQAAFVMYLNNQVSEVG